MITYRAEHPYIRCTSDYLGEQGMLELQASKVRLRYQRLRAPTSLTELATALHQRALKRERAELKRLKVAR